MSKPIHDVVFKTRSQRKNLEKFTKRNVKTACRTLLVDRRWSMVFHLRATEHIKIQVYKYNKGIRG